MIDKKVLFIFNGNWPWEVRISKEILSLKKSGYKIALLSRNQLNLPNYEKLENIDVYRLNHLFKNNRLNTFLTIPFYLNPFWIFAIYKTIKKSKPNILIIRDIPLAPVCIFLAKLFNIKCIIDMAENYPAFIKVNKKYVNGFILRFLFCKLDWYKYIEKYSVKNSNHTFVVIEENKKRLLENYEINHNKISIVGNTPLLQNIHENNINLNQEKLQIVYTGCMDFEFRGIKTVIDAAAKLRSENVFFNFVGGGDLLDFYIKYADRLNLDNVKFWGQMSHDKLLDLLSSQNIGIVPHTRSGVVEYTIPNKLFDYMANSLPVIVSTATPLKRITEECDCGYVFEAEDSDSLKELIIKILNNKEELYQKGKNGYVAVKEKYNWEIDEKRLLNAIKALLEEYD